MAFEKILGDACPYHAERSEASVWLASRVPRRRCFAALSMTWLDIPGFFLNIHHRVQGAPLDRNEDAINRVPTLLDGVSDQSLRAILLLYIPALWPPLPR